MADEDEVDVEGDFDMNIGMDHEALPNLYLDMNEPPSKSANLLPEYTQHPWMLEQGWSLDHCTDEKSKAAIEKMLQEEQHYMNGRVTVAKVTSSAHTSASFQKQAQQRRAWTDEERQTFQKGLEIYGRKWARIAELIPDKTTQQVKSFGQHFFKIKAREEEEKKRKDQKGVAKTHLPIGIQNAIRAVTTAQPTVKVSPKKLSTYYDSSSLVWTEPPPPSIPLRTSPPPLKPKKEPKSIPSATTTSALKRGSPPKGRKGRQSKPTKDKGNTAKGVQSKVSNSVPIVKSEPKVSSLIASSEVVRIENSRAEDSEDSDVDIDIDIEDDEWSAGAGPTSVAGPEQEDRVYRQLVESAGINPLHLNGEEAESLENNSSDSDDNDSEHLTAEQHNAAGETAESGNSDTATVAVIKTEPEEQLGLTEEATTDCDLGPTESTFISEQLYGVLPPTPPDQILSVPSTSKLKPQEETSTLEQVSPDFPETLDNPGDAGSSGDVVAVMSVETTLMTSSVTSDDTSRMIQLAEYSSMSEEDDIDEHPDEFGILTSLGDIVYLPNPTEAVTLDRDSIDDQEQKIHSEFFSQRPGAKTPDRYLKIRNFILDAWEKCRPNYLNKTSVRPGLKNCGDVNCIGRIHAYLEQVGAINFGCNQVQYLRSNKTVPIKVKVPKEQPDPQALRNDMRIRKRRVRDTQGDWVDEKDLEGKTIEHKEAEKLEKRQKMVRLRTSYDPFKLIPCLDFSEEQPAPFILTVESCAAVTMDVHAHLSKTEVIGLLGGDYCRDRGQLTVTMAVPCESLSTGMQCEMDPVSQTEACEAIERRGQSVVGWYHSHPTFIPDPSCRDIETQQKYQDWFGKGGNPFVGVIVSPYCQGRLDPQSITRCLMVLNKSDAQGSVLGQPYQFAYQLCHALWDTERFREQLVDLADKYATYPNRVHLLQHYTSRSALTCLQKLVESLSHSFPESPPEGRPYLRQLVEEVITTKYRSDGTVRGLEEGAGVVPSAEQIDEDLWLPDDLSECGEVVLPQDILPADLVSVTPGEVQ